MVLGGLEVQIGRHTIVCVGGCTPAPCRGEVTVVTLLLGISLLACNMKVKVLQISAPARKASQHSMVLLPICSTLRS